MYPVTVNTFYPPRRDAFVRECYTRHLGADAEPLNAWPATQRGGPGFQAITVTDHASRTQRGCDVAATANVHFGRLPFTLARFSGATVLGMGPCMATLLTDKPDAIEVTRLCVDPAHPGALPVVLRAVLGAGIVAGAKGVVAMAVTPVHARLYRRVGLREVARVTVESAPHGWYLDGHEYTLMYADLLDCLTQATPAMKEGAGFVI